MWPRAFWTKQLSCGVAGVVLVLLGGVLGCNLDRDCSLNGVCRAGKCSCDPGWTGASCGSLAFRPAPVAAGYRNVFPSGSPSPNISSWGGGVLYDNVTSEYFMWATELAGGCGMHTWTTNSQTIRASSRNATGLYTREAVQVPIWTHEVNVVRGDKGEFVAFMSYNVPSPYPYCHGCADGSTNPACKKGRGVPEIEDTDPTYMTWGATPRGNWSAPVRVSMAKPEMDTNFAPVILPNGTLLGMWRDHHPGGKHSTPHLVTAAHWKDPASYHWSTEQLFSDHDVPGGIEDMFLWVDGRGHFHALFHIMFDCDNCGGHAFSEDGLKWTWGGTAYTGVVQFDDGTSFEFPYVERPHLVMGPDGITPLALTNGVKPGWGVDGDQSFTLLRPLAS